MDSYWLWATGSKYTFSLSIYLYGIIHWTVHHVCYVCCCMEHIMFLILRDSTISIWLRLLAFFSSIWPMINFSFIEHFQTNLFGSISLHWLRFPFFLPFIIKMNEIGQFSKVCFCSVEFFFSTPVLRKQSEYACAIFLVGIFESDETITTKASSKGSSFPVCVYIYSRNLIF